MARTSTLDKISAVLAAFMALIMTIGVGHTQAQQTAEEYIAPPLSQPRWQYYQ